MSAKAVIKIEGAYARLLGAPISELEACLAVPDPKRFFNRAFKDERWDGNVRLYEHRDFPAGLTDHVATHLQNEGYEVSIIRPRERQAIDLSRWTRDYLPGITLWDNQYEAGIAMLKSQCGTVKSPTGSGKTEIMAGVARYLWEERGWRTVVVVPKAGLLIQTVKRFNKYYDGDIRVGMYGDGVREPGDIVVGTAQTLISFKPRTKTVGRGRKKRKQVIPYDAEIRTMLHEYEVLMLDECHHSSSVTWEDIALFSGALRRYGLSGTPLKNSEVADMRMIGATGSLIYTCETKTLIDEGRAAKPKIVMVGCEDIFGPEMEKVWTMTRDEVTGKWRRYPKVAPYKDAYRQAIVENDKFNREVVRATEWLVDHGKRTLILCRQKAHWKRLAELLDGTGIDYRAVWGATETEEREDVKAMFGDKKLKVILASTIFDEGEDVPGIEAVVLAEGVKACTNVLQRIGRGMRKKTEGVNEVWVVDFVPTCHPKLVEHGCERADAYEAEGHEVKIVDRWNPDDPNMLPFLIWDDYA